MRYAPSPSVDNTTTLLHHCDGVAQVSAEMQEEWRKNVQRYLRRRENLRVAVVFVDSQREPQVAPHRAPGVPNAMAPNQFGMAHTAHALRRELCCPALLLHAGQLTGGRGAAVPTWTHTPQRPQGGAYPGANCGLAKHRL